MRLEISVGAFAPDLAEQLAKQELELEAHSLEHFERDRQAIGRLGIRGLLSDGERERAALRLMKKMGKQLKAVVA